MQIYSATSIVALCPEQINLFSDDFMSHLEFDIAGEPGSSTDRAEPQYVLEPGSPAISNFSWSGKILFYLM
jgi:hypothetical protein